MKQSRHTTRVLSANKGLNNKIAPEYLKLGRNGFEYLSQCVNMDSDSSGRLVVRNGYRPTSIEHKCHSLFSNNNVALYVTGDALCLLDLNTFTSTPIRRVTPGARMSYIDAPPDRVYYGNGFEKGVVTEGVSQDWAMKNPLVKAGQNPEDAPIGHLLEVFSGYVFVAARQADQNVLFHSMPFSPNSFDFARAFFVYDEFITMLSSVEDGIYVGTEKDLFFLSGNNPKEFVQKKIDGIAPLKNSAVKTNTKELGMDTSENCVMFSTNNGIFVGLSSGQVTQITFDNIELQERYLYADAYIRDGKYVVSFNK